MGRTLPVIIPRCRDVLHCALFSVDWTSGEESGSGVSSDEDWCGDGQDEVDGGVGSSPKVRPKQRSLYKRMKSLVSASNLMVKMPSKRKM